MKGSASASRWVGGRHLTWMNAGQQMQGTRHTDVGQLSSSRFCSARFSNALVELPLSPFCTSSITFVRIWIRSTPPSLSGY